MGKGRKPTPPQIRILEGSRGHGGAKGTDMAIVCPGVPPAPPHLTGLALEHWNLLTANLGSANLLEFIDAGSLEAACVSYARAVAADEELKQHGGTTYMDANGNLKKHPAATVSRESWETYRHFVLEFGGTPCARARLKIPAKNGEVDDFNEFIKQA